MNGVMTVTCSAQERLVLPTVMAKLAIDSTSIQSLVINREIFIQNREIVIISSKIGRSPAKSEALHNGVTVSDCC